MRTREGRYETWFAPLPNASTNGPGWTATNVGAGNYDIRVTDPAYRFVTVSPAPNPGGTQSQTSSALSESPPRMQVQFLSGTGAAGSYGGYVAIHVQRKTA